MITTEYSVEGPADITIAIVADLHEFEPKPVLSRLSEIRPDVIAVPGDLFENHEFGENLDKEDDSLISRGFSAAIICTKPVCEISCCFLKTDNKYQALPTKRTTVILRQGHFLYCGNI